jgi:1,4-dihydroxy-6-naphthoate synthase
LQQTIGRLTRQSIQYAYSKYPELNDYIRDHAQEMSEEVMRKHIDLYVNDYSLSLGKEGKEAVIKLMNVYSKMNNKEINQDDLFVKND